MKKRAIANGILAGALVLMALGGILAAGGLLGWFDRTAQAALLEQPRGIVYLQRQGLFLTPSEDTALRRGDRLETQAAAAACLRAGSSTLAVSQNTQLAVLAADPAGLTLQVDRGEVFALPDPGSPLTLVAGPQALTLREGAYSLIVRSGSQELWVYAGEVQVDQVRAEAGQRLVWTETGLEQAACQPEDLSDFCMAQIRAANETRQLCFSNGELDAVLSRRQEALEAQLQGPTRPTEPPATQPAPTQAPTQATQAPETAPPATTVPPETEPPVTAPPATEPPETQVLRNLTCSLTIRCDTILDHWESLDPAKQGYVPQDGCILSVNVAFAPGETAFDVLKRACDAAGIPLEYSWTPLYGSDYIEGIQHLYEFDCGPESGWMYQVNGQFPSCGCSSYPLADGDAVAFRYTCVGLGADLR